MRGSISIKVLRGTREHGCWGLGKEALTNFTISGRPNTLNGRL
jgi:hypothetical protein